MNGSGEKRFIPSSNKEWNLELPDEDSNSLVTKHGKNWDNGYNFDEREDESGSDELSFDDLADEVKYDPEEAQRARGERE